MRLSSFIVLLALALHTGGLARAQADPGQIERTDLQSGMSSRASTEDEEIVDPELTANPPSSAPSGDEVIVDPELTQKAPESGDEGDSGGFWTPTGQLQLVLRSRIGVDLQWADLNQEVFENTEILLLEAQIRRSERIRFEVGVRARYELTARDPNALDPSLYPLESSLYRHNLDVVPTAGFIDATLASGLSVRAGYQMTHLGRFDVFSASNVLQSVDMRSGPAAMPEAVEIAQLALRLDADPISWLSLRAFYLPFFRPDLAYLIESDYALFPSKYEDQTNMLVTVIGSPGSVPEINYDRRLIRDYLPRAARERIAESGFSAFTPEPDLASPQGAFSATAHGSSGELTVTAATALEHLPALKLSREVLNQLSQPNLSVDSEPDVATPPPFEIEYNRFTVCAVDGATSWGPVQLGFEATYTFNRTLYALTPNISEPANWIPDPEQSDIAQLGVRGEYTEDPWIAVVEGFISYALDLPTEPSSRWASLDRGRYLYGGAAHVSWNYNEHDLTLETSLAVVNGPSYFVAPRVELRIISELYAELGGFFIGPLGDPYAVCPGLGAYSVGCIYDTVDQIFIGMRWVP
jgi:hypothetical protein